jgi:pimeloyl-ACP methyl ester carboxylesterase
MKARAATAFVVLAVLVAIGAVFEQVERRRDAARFPQVGGSVNIGGRALNLFCSGQGSPAVIFESDAFHPGYSWGYVQRQTAAFTRACWYDRAGYGWSDPAPAPHTSRDSARDLHALLRAAGIAPPYVLAAAGFGAFNSRVFCALYRGEVAGLVLSDATPEDELDRFPEERGGAGRVPFHLGFPPDLVIRSVSAIGLMRLTVHRNGREFRAQGLTPAEQATLSGLQRLPKMRAAFLAEQAFATGPDEVRAAGKLGSLPLVVLASDRPVETQQQIARREAELQMQQQMANLSTRGRLVLVKDAEGSIQYESPDAIVATLRQLLAP